MKIVVVCAKDGKGWRSCLNAEGDLQRIYKKAFPGITHFIYLNDPRRFDSIESDSKYISSIAIKICKINPTHIVFLSHRLHSAPILYALDHFGFRQASYLFHIYGNWPLRLARWQKSQDFILGRRVQFLTNSWAFQKVVSAPMRLGSRMVTVAPLTINRDIFRFSAKERMVTRKSLNISENEIVVLYAGRLSRDKGLLLFIKSALDIFNQNQTQLRVIICGSFGENDESTMKPWLEKLKKKAGSKFDFLGELKQKKLAKIYCASDIFVSPSLYEYEAFGFAPVEALISGLNCIFTKWLGYSDLAQASELIQWLSAPDKNKSKELNELNCQNTLTKKLNFLLKKRPFKSNKERTAAYKYLEMYSHSAQIARLQTLLGKPSWPKFQGFKQ